MELGFINLQTSCIIGCLDKERIAEQPIQADVEIRLNTQQAAAEDDINLTVGYDVLAQMFEGIAKQGKFLLLETLATEFQRELMGTYPHITGGVICIRKPLAIPNADAGFVRLRW